MTLFALIALLSLLNTILPDFIRNYVSTIRKRKPQCRTLS